MNDAYCYVCIKPDTPGAYAAAVDIPECAADNAKMVAKALRKGHKVERVPVEQARTMLGEYLNWRKTA